MQRHVTVIAASQAHYAAPSAVGERQQVFNPETLKRVTWPTGRKEMLRAAAEVALLMLNVEHFCVSTEVYAQI